MKMQSMLNGEIQNRIEEIGRMEVGSDEYNNAVTSIAKLVDKTIEIEKMNLESEKQMDEKDFQKAKLEEEKKSRKWRDGIAIGTTGTQILFIGFWLGMMFIFEEEGTITTKGGNQVFNSMFKLLFKR